MKKYLGIDYGARRIGLALGTDIGIASPLATLDATGGVYKKIQHIIDEHSVDELVLGLPRGLDGQETRQTKIVRKFKEELERFDLPVHFQDEAGTSAQAEEELQQYRKEYRKEDIDRLAATIILQDYLDENKNL